MIETCLSCRTPAGEQAPEACPVCGSRRWATVDDEGIVTGFSAAAGLACSDCGETDRALGFRRFRRVIGLLVMDLVYNSAGYYCDACRKKRFWRWQGLTALLGWWGLIALIFRNPYAIVVNFRALSGPPRRPQAFGALTLDEVAEALEPAIPPAGKADYTRPPR